VVVIVQQHTLIADQTLVPNANLRGAGDSYTLIEEDSIPNRQHCAGPDKNLDRIPLSRSNAKALTHCDLTATIDDRSSLNT
jgi:hypothetical protein